MVVGLRFLIYVIAKITSGQKQSLMLASIIVDYAMSINMCPNFSATPFSSYE